MVWSSFLLSSFLHWHQHCLAEEQRIFKIGPKLPASHTCTVGVCPEQGWLYGPSLGCSRPFGRAPGLQCTSEEARAVNDLPQFPGFWTWRNDLSTHRKWMPLFLNRQSILVTHLLWHSIFIFSLVISALTWDSANLYLLFILCNQGLQFVV
jgi:hypothetical protein